MMISKKEALNIAKRQFIPDDSVFTVYEECPGRVHFYMAFNEPAWYITCPANPTYDENILRSSRLIVVSKISGKVLYDGTAGDEG